MEDPAPKPVADWQRIRRTVNILTACRLSGVVDARIGRLEKDRVAVADGLIDPADSVGRSEADDNAFTAFFTAEFGAIAAYCARLLPAGAAEDAAQEALVRVWTHWRTVRDPHAYTFLVATNLARRQWLADSKQRVLNQQLDADQRTRNEAPAPHAHLRDLVNRLPARLRTPTLLHYYADLPTAEIARLLRRPPGTIRRRLTEARRLLGDALTEPA
jgi:RNA polymerase sigma-70 factor (ECF subfamily)